MIIKMSTGCPINNIWRKWWFGVFMCNDENMENTSLRWQFKVKNTILNFSFPLSTTQKNKLHSWNNPPLTISFPKNYKTIKPWKFTMTYLQNYTLWDSIHLERLDVKISFCLTMYKAVLNIVMQLTEHIQNLV